MTRIALAVVMTVAIAGAVPAPMPSPALSRVVDAHTRAPIAGAIVTDGEHEVRTDAHGQFSLSPQAARVGVRAYGYARTQVDAGTLRRPNAEVSLTPFKPRALYLSMFGVASGPLRNAALRIADTTEINAFVIDIKGDRGYIAYHTANALAEQAGAQKVITIRDLPVLAASLHEHGLYAIARIVVFKDNLLASARPDLAVRRGGGAIYHDREGLAWADPFNRDVWAYNIAVAVDAARAGFDEVQFDYVRLPDAPGLALPQGRSQAARLAAIAGFLGEARRAVAPFNVFLAADVFGYVCWNRNDTGIGQRLDTLIDVVDYLSPMLYPSSFQFGIPGYRNPVANPYPIVRLSLEEAVERTRVPPARFRPWLQAFPDYAFHGGSFRSGEVRVQIRAADDVGTNGWMLWNPRNQYSAADLRQ
jgi:hypothetical protein